MLKMFRLLMPAMLLALYGCTTHYMVRDPDTGARYYTTVVERVGNASAVKFKDDSSGAEMSLQQAEVRKISGAEYDAGIRGNQ